MRLLNFKNKFHFINQSFKLFSMKQNAQFAVDNTNKNLLKKQLLETPFEKVEEIIKILNYLPEETDNVINKYLDSDSTQRAYEIFKYHKNVSINTFKKIENMLLKRFVGFYFFKYLQNKIEFYHVFEFIKYEDFIVVSYVSNQLCLKNKFNECFIILNYFNFSSKINLSYENKLKLLKYLEGKFGKIDKKGKKLNFNDILKSYKNNEILINLKINDTFEPYKQDNYKLRIKRENIIFIDNLSDLKLNLDLFKNNEIYGIDCEWKPYNSVIENKTGASIIAISTNDKVLLIDYLKLKNEESFLELFKNTFENKKFVCHAFHNDLQELDDQLADFLKNKCELIEIKDIINKNNETKQSLNSICKELFKSELCKVEQCSNWNERPLRQRQLHYAALDSHLLLNIYTSYLN